MVTITMIITLKVIGIIFDDSNNNSGKQVDNHNNITLRNSDGNSKVIPMISINILRA